MDVILQLNRTLAGRYAIEREIGAGGMATVYLARDLRHDRHVALKLLNPELGAVLGVERFLSEIKVTANLQHPNLLPLFDSGEAEGLLFYVMPFVEGESLRAKLERERQLPVDEALRIAIAVASALNYAHRHGVIHRDLKPENILLNDGQPLVADFGIALAVTNAGGSRITQTGLSLGTPQYMSPEQATGDRAIDGRTDIYSLAAVTYEMLAGDPPHTGSTSQAIIARLLTDKARPIRAMRESVPAHVELALERALAKLPADRFATAGDFADALSGAKPMALPTLSAADLAAQPSQSRRRARSIRELIAWGIAVASTVAVFIARRQTATPRQPLHVVLEPWPDSAGKVDAHLLYAEMSRDRSRIVFDVGQPLRPRLFLRRADVLDPTPIVGLDSGTAGMVSLSPDGNWLLFQAGGNLRKIRLDGGAAVTIADSTTRDSGRSWGDNDVIAYISRGTLRLASPGGGPTRLLAKADSSRGQVRFNWPEVLPGGRAVIVTLWNPDPNVVVVSVPDGKITTLGLPGSFPKYMPPGYLVFGRQSEGAIYAVPFSLRQSKTTGSPVRIADHVPMGGGGRVSMSVAVDGTLIYPVGELSKARLVAVDRKGAERVITPLAQRYLTPRISADGRRIAVAVDASPLISAGATGAQDIWTFDMASRAFARITTDTFAYRAEWGADQQHLLYPQRKPHRSQSGAELNLEADVVTTRIADASEPAKEALRAPAGVQSLSISSSGHVLVTTVGPVGARHSWIAPLAHPESLHAIPPAAKDEWAARVSPDGHLLAYMSNESGRDEVYVRDLQTGGGKASVSSGGGVEPMWAPQGQELFYRGGGHLIAATISTAKGVAVDKRDTLFADVYLRLGNGAVANYDALPGGRELLMIKSTPADTKLVMVVNWRDELRRLIGERK